MSHRARSWGGGGLIEPWFIEFKLHNEINKRGREMRRGDKGYFFQALFIGERGSSKRVKRGLKGVLIEN